MLWIEGLQVIVVLFNRRIWNIVKCLHISYCLHLYDLSYLYDSAAVVAVVLGGTAFPGHKQRQEQQ